MSIRDNLHDMLDKALRSAHKADLADIKSSQEDAPKDDKRLIKRIALTDPDLTAQYGGGGYGLYKPRFSHISFKTLKEMSLRDPIIATIMQTRINQIVGFSRPQASRYDTGFKICPVDAEMDIEKGSDEEGEIAAITDYVMNTGVVDDHRPAADLMSFETWLKLIVRDRLTYGAVGIETIRDASKRIYAFLPVPTETIFYANKAIDNENIKALATMNKPTYAAGAEREIIQEEMLERVQRGEIEYVQVVEGRVVEGFTREELVYKLGNPQNFIDNNGYCLGELEFATTTITSHLQADNYNKLYFTHGFAARGLLHIVGDVTPAQLQAFRAQWYSQVSGNANSWRTPIIAGVDEVKWIQLAGTNRDMEYTQYTDHLIRVLCGLFQISPLEIGMDYLTRGSSQGGLGESSNEWKIEEAQDRGLRPLLVWIESIVNSDILPYAFPEVAGKYKFCFVGLDAESKEQELERQKAELTLHTPIDDIRKELDKDPVLGGKIILNPEYINFLLRTHKIGEIREHLLGYKGDATNPEFDYVADPLFMNNREMLMAPQGVDENGNPLPAGPGGVDEEGNPVGGAPPPDGGIPVAPEVEEAVELYLEAHPEIIEKSLVKSIDPSKINKRFDNLRKQYMSVYKDIEASLLKDILDGVKEEIVHEDEETDSEEKTE